MRKVIPAALLLFLLLLPAGASAQTCQAPALRKGAKPSEVPLCLVAAQVVKTLDAFNNGAGSKSLPRLSSVSFDFHTSVSKAEGFSFQLLLFNLGATHEQDSSNDVSFTYTVPPPGAARPRTTGGTQDLSQALLGTLEAAAAQVKQTQSVGPATFSNLTVTLTYGVIWDTTGGGDGTIGLVTLTGSIDRKRADVQTLTLSFGPV